MRNAHQINKVKTRGEVFSPKNIVDTILNFGGYFGSGILRKHVMENSCGNGAFLTEIVSRYCNEAINQGVNTTELKVELETYIHGIEIDNDSYNECISALNKIAAEYNISAINWDITNDNALSISTYDGLMDFVFGNPPYVRVHNLNDAALLIKNFAFANSGMTDLYIMFIELGMRMLNGNGKMAIITPSSWLSSNAGAPIRRYINEYGYLKGLIDLIHYQPFKATTYTAISLFEKRLSKDKKLSYYTFDPRNDEYSLVSVLSYAECFIDNKIFINTSDTLKLIRQIDLYNLSSKSSKLKVRNGFATLADSVFIGNHNFTSYVIDIIKASTGEWTKCIFPYDRTGKPVPFENIKCDTKLYSYLEGKKEALIKCDKDARYWYLFGRTQAINDVFSDKIAINTIIKDIDSIKINEVKSGQGVYSGLYIISTFDVQTIKRILKTQDFVDYIKALKNYKSGGYYTFSSRDLEKYLNFKLHTIKPQIKYEQQGISQLSLGFI